jgi:two-component system NarL family sensor kinase
MTLELTDEEVCLSVYDDGRGFEVTETLDRQTRNGAQEGHFGLTGMSERVKLLGGTLCLESNPEAGTCLVICVPIAS